MHHLCETPTTMRSAGMRVIFSRLATPVHDLDPGNFPMQNQRVKCSFGGQSPGKICVFSGCDYYVGIEYMMSYDVVCCMLTKWLIFQMGENTISSCALTRTHYAIVSIFPTISNGNFHWPHGKWKGTDSNSTIRIYSHRLNLLLRTQIRKSKLNRPNNIKGICILK